MKTKILTSIILISAGIIVTSCDDDNYNIQSDPIIKSVVTGTADVTAVSATINGSVSNLTSQASTAYSAGVYYSTDENNITSNKVTAEVDANGDFTVTLTGLSKGKTYYYRTFVTLQNKVSYYGEIKSFETTDAKISTLDAQEITAVSAILSGRFNGVSDMIENDNSGINYGVLLSVDNDENQAKTGKIFICASSNNEYNTTIKGFLSA